MDKETVKDFQEALRSAGSRLNLFDFCRAAGFEEKENNYTVDKFQKFGEAVRILSNFDAKTLSAILNAGIEQRATPLW